MHTFMAADTRTLLFSATPTSTVNQCVLLEESISSFLRGTIDTSGLDVKPELRLTSVAEGSTPSNANENHRESDAFSSRGTLDIESHSATTLSFPSFSPRSLHLHSPNRLRDILSSFKGPLDDRVA